MYPNTANSSPSSSSSFTGLRQATAPVVPRSSQSSADILSETETSDHQSLLSHFPIELRDEIAQEFPTLATLQHFQKELLDNEIPLDRTKPVARMLKASRDDKELKQSRVAQERELLFHNGPSKDGVNQRNPEGATSLHSAILCWSVVKVRQLLERGARPEVTVRPDQRKAPFIALASLAKKLVSVDENAAQESQQGNLAPGEKDHDRNAAIIEGLKLPLANATEEISTRVLIEHAGENALTLAISYEAPIAIIKLLVEHCAKHCAALLTQPDANGNPPLLLAAAANRPDALEVVKLLLESGVKLDVNQVNGLQRTALMEAVRRGNAPMVELLLHGGADCTLTDNHGVSATAHAVLCEYPSLHRIMTDFQSQDPQAVGNARLKVEWSNDLFAAVRRGQVAVVTEMLSDLKKSLSTAEGAEESIKEAEACALALIVKVAFLEAIAVPGNGATIHCLMTHGSADANLPGGPDGLCPWQNAVDKEGFETLLAAVCKAGPAAFEVSRRQALLQSAVGHGSVQYVCHALDAGASIEQIDPATGCNALMTAVKRNDLALIVELLKRGASIVGNAVAVPGNAAPTKLVDCALATARDLQPEALARELVMFIMENCPDPYLKQDHAGLLLDLAVAMKLPGLVSKLIEDRKLSPAWFGGRPNSLLIEIVRAGSAEFAAAVLHPGAPRLHLLDAINGTADEALELARDQNEPEIFHLILKACNIANSNPPASLMRRLMWAVQVGCIDSCDLILTQGELQLPNAAPAEENPLILALQCGQHKVIEFLLGRGAHACARHGRKASALSRALAARDWKAAKIMMAHDQFPDEFAAALPQLLTAAVANDNGKAFGILVSAYSIGASELALSTMLQQAVKLGSLEACTSLLKRGANVNCTTAEGMPLLELALLSKHPNMDIVRLLFRNETWVAARYAGRADDFSHDLDFTEIVKALVGAGASTDQKIQWMGLMFCELRESGFTAGDDQKIKGLGNLFDKGMSMAEEDMGQAIYLARKIDRRRPDFEAVQAILDKCMRVLGLRDKRLENMVDYYYRGD